MAKLMYSFLIYTVKINFISMSYYYPLNHLLNNYSGLDQSFILQGSLMERSLLNSLDRRTYKMQEIWHEIILNK